MKLIFQTSQSPCLYFVCACICVCVSVSLSFSLCQKSNVSFILTVSFHFGVHNFMAPTKNNTHDSCKMGQHCVFCESEEQRRQVRFSGFPNPCALTFQHVYGAVLFCGWDFRCRALELRNFLWLESSKKNRTLVERLFTQDNKIVPPSRTESYQKTLTKLFYLCCFPLYIWRTSCFWYKTEIKSQEKETHFHTKGSHLFHSFQELELTASLQSEAQTKKEHTKIAWELCHRSRPNKRTAPSLVCNQPGKLHT